MGSPRWSPNGRFIAGLHTGFTGGMKIFDIETQRWSVLQEKDESDFPTWSANSQFIYFLRPSDDPGVFRVSVSNSVEERVVDLTGFRHTGAVTLWMGLDPTDTPMLIRDVGTDDIYALTLEQNSSRQDLSLDAGFARANDLTRRHCGRSLTTTPCQSVKTANALIEQGLVLRS